MYKRQTLKLQGFGHHTPAEQDELAIRDVDALAATIREEAFLMGDRPCGADATVFSFVAQLLTPVFVTPTRTAAEKHQNLGCPFSRNKNAFWTVDRDGLPSLSAFSAEGLRVPVRIRVFYNR